MMDAMRTTVTLDPDVAEAIRRLMAERSLTFKEAINTTLRRDLGVERQTQPYRAPALRLGVRPGVDLTKAL